MIGQQRIIELLTDKIQPSFLILEGPAGSGKKTLVNMLYPNKIQFEIKVDSIRQMIEMANKVFNQIFFVPDCDTMSTQAQNALLKIVEECPNGNRFIITVSSLNNILPTIKSRGCAYTMDKYTREQIIQYAKSNGIAETDICGDVCEVPGEVNILKKCGVVDFYDYVSLVMDNIAEVSGANAFKIANKVALKDEEDKYDLLLFLRAFRRMCMEMIVKNDFTNYSSNQYVNAIVTTTHYICDLKIKGVNKQSLIDAWILDIRKDWMYAD